MDGWSGYHFKTVMTTRVPAVPTNPKVGARMPIQREILMMVFSSSAPLTLNPSKTHPNPIPYCRLFSISCSLQASYFMPDITVVKSGDSAKEILRKGQDCLEKN